MLWSSDENLKTRFAFSNKIGAREILSWHGEILVALLRHVRLWTSFAHECENLKTHQYGSFMHVWLTFTFSNSDIQPRMSKKHCLKIDDLKNFATPSLSRCNCLNIATFLTHDISAHGITVFFVFLYVPKVLDWLETKKKQEVVS